MQVYFIGDLFEESQIEFNWGSYLIFALRIFCVGNILLSSIKKWATDFLPVYSGGGKTLFYFDF